jgi:GntR family transcriptional regulator, transcriptional repressor for pyruvate dehydrogenase complex
MALTRSSLPDQVFQQLIAGVLDGRYAPGERLPPQRTLAAELGVNMASLREGIKRLEQLRLVEVKHGDAMRVTDWRTHGGLDVLAYAATQFTEPLFEARRILLTQAAALAATRRTDEQAAQLDAIAAEVPTQWTDLAFMATVIAAADNLVFSLILNQVRDLYLADLEQYAAIVADAPSYAAVAQAIAAGDADAAEREMGRLAGWQEEAMRDHP